VAVIFQLFVVFDGKYKNNLPPPPPFRKPIPETIDSCLHMKIPFSEIRSQRAMKLLPVNIYIWATAATAAQLVGFMTLKA